MDNNSLRPSLTPGFAVSFSLLCAAFALAVFMSVFLTVAAAAQEIPPCARMEVMIERMREVYNEQVVWQGIKVTPAGQIETFLFQSANGETWTLVDVVGKDVAGKPVGCFVAVGTNGVPNDMDRGV